MDEDYRNIVKAVLAYFSGKEACLLSQTAPYRLSSPLAGQKGGQDRGNLNCVGDYHTGNP